MSALTAAELRAMLPGLESGMVPKMEACLHAVDGGVPQRTSWTDANRTRMLLEVFTAAGVGTQVLPDGPHRDRSTMTSRRIATPATSTATATR